MAGSNRCLAIIAVVCVLVGFFGQACRGAAEPAGGGQAGGASGGFGAPALPYLAVITGEKVNIRSGPAEAYYRVGQANKDDEVIVSREQHGWAEIYPTGVCFSYIARQFVELADESPQATAGQEVISVESPGASGGAAAAASVANEKAGAETAPAKGKAAGTGLAALIGKEPVWGTVTADAVRVRAGSVKVPPANANTVQVLLNKGSEVQIIGQRDDYYKIACPPSCYFWVSLDYVKRLGPATEADVEKMRAQASHALIGGGEPEKKQEQLSADEQDRQAYLQASEMLEAQLTKPMGERDFKAVRDKLAGLIKESRSDSVKAAAAALQRRLARCELALNIFKQSEQQDKQLNATLAQIEEKIEDLSVSYHELIKSDKEIVVKGRLAYSAVFTAPTKNRRFLVLDEKERIVCYAVSGREGLDLNEWVDQEVSMLGQAKYDAFSKSRVLYVTAVVREPTSRK